MTRKQEDFANRALALLLREHGVVADYEQRAGRRRMDIVASVDGVWLLALKLLVGDSVLRR